MMNRPSGLKNASSGTRKVWPAARSPGRGNSQRTRPCGSTMTSRLFSLSAMSRSAGSTDGSEPGCTCPTSCEAPAHGCASGGVRWTVAGTLRGVDVLALAADDGGRFVNRAVCAVGWALGSATTIAVSTARTTAEPPRNRWTRAVAMRTPHVYGVAGPMSSRAGERASGRTGRHPHRQPVRLVNAYPCAATCTRTICAISTKWQISADSAGLGSGVDGRDHRVGVAVQVVDLLLQRLRVRTHDVRHAESDDDVGDALVLEPLHAVDGVRIERDHVDLERLVRYSLGLADLGDAREQR